MMYDTAFQPAEYLKAWIDPDRPTLLLGRVAETFDCKPVDAIVWKQKSWRGQGVWIQFTEPTVCAELDRRQALALRDWLNDVLADEALSE